MPLAADKPALAVSPDGRTLAYAATRDGVVQLVVYDLDARTATPLEGTDAAHTPFFSPDGKRLGFFARGRLWIAESTGGGTPTAVADVSNGWGAAWDTDGSIYFTPVEEGGVMRLDPTTGRVSTAVSYTGYMPEPLGPGAGLLISAGGQTGLARNGTMVRPLFVGISARRLQADYLVYALPGTLMAVPFDGPQGLVTGRSLVLAGDLRTGPYGVAQFAVGREGTVVYAPGRDTLFAHFVSVTDGRRTRLGIRGGRYQEFSASPDGTRLAATLMGDTPERMAELLVFDLARAGTEGAVSRAIPLPEPTAPDYLGWPRWDIDGQHLFYALRTPTSTGMKLLWSRPDGSERHVVWQSDDAGVRWLYPMSFSPDGRYLAVFGPSPGSRMDLYVLPVRAADGSILDNQTPVPYLATPALESFPQFSPDGASIAYASDTSGRYEVYVSAYPAPGMPCRVSHDGGMDPTWTQGGREIVYQSETALYARTIASLADCRFGLPHLMFDGFPDRPGFGHDVLPGRAWLMLESDDFTRPTTSLNVITNVADALQRRLPAKAAR